MTFDDFYGWILGRASRGWPIEMLLKMACVSIVRHEEAAERWVRLEVSDPGRSAPLWLNEHEAQKLSSALKTQRGAEFRLIRQQLQQMFDD